MSDALSVLKNAGWEERCYGGASGFHITVLYGGSPKRYVALVSVKEGSAEKVMELDEVKTLYKTFRHIRLQMDDQGMRPGVVYTNRMLMLVEYILRVMKNIDEFLEPTRDLVAAISNVGCEIGVAPIRLHQWTVNIITKGYGALQFHMTFDNTVLAVMGVEAAKRFSQFVESALEGNLDDTDEGYEPEEDPTDGDEPSSDWEQGDIF